MNDRAIKSKVETLCGEIDKWLANRSVDKPLDGKTLKVTLTEVPSIKQAITDAKAEFLNKDSYKSEDFDISDGSLYKEATDAIGIAIIEYAKTEVENIYNAEYKPEDKVYTWEQYNTALRTTLQLKEDGSVDEKNLAGLSTVLNLLKGLAPDDETTLQQKIEDYTGELVTTLNKDYEKNIYYNEALKSHGLLDKDVTTFNQISWVEEAIKDGKEDMKNAKNVAQLREIEENAIDNALAGLIRFVNKLIGDFSKLNSTGKMLKNADKETIQDVISKENLTASELIAGFKTMMDTLAPTVKV